MGTKKMTFITAAVASVAFAAVPTAASAAPAGGLTKSYDAAYERVVDAGGQPGRNIADDGDQTATGESSGGGDLSGVAACESGGDPGAVSPDGQYRGKYQFDQQTWESVGGSGDPASAPEAEQDQRAQQLQSQRGSSPWPVCGG